LIVRHHQDGNSVLLHYKPVVSNSTRKLLFDTKYPTLFDTVAICPFYISYLSPALFDTKNIRFILFDTGFA
jgi:hypothetical protein